MVKKILFLLTFLLITLIPNINVKAAVIAPNSVYATFDDGSVISSGYYTSSNGLYWASNTLLGGVSYQSWVKSINFYYTNPNLCSGKALNISGKIRITNNFFNYEGYNLFVNNNGQSMSCVLSLENSSDLNFRCTGKGGGALSIYFQQTTYGTPRQYDVLVSRDLQYTCDITSEDVVANDNKNTQSIIDNQNRNTNKIIQEQQETTDAVNGLKDSMTSESQPNTNSNINDMNNMVASDTPITDLITMPLTLINAYINGIGSTCSSFNLGSLLGTNLTIPCINLEQRLGSNLWNTIDILCCIFLCYEIAMLFISAFDGITSLRDDFEGLYQPRHADTGYVPKHGGGN